MSTQSELASSKMALVEKNERLEAEVSDLKVCCVVVGANTLGSFGSFVDERGLHVHFSRTSTPMTNPSARVATTSAHTHTHTFCFTICHFFFFSFFSFHFFHFICPLLFVLFCFVSFFLRLLLLPNQNQLSEARPDGQAGKRSQMAADLQEMQDKNQQALADLKLSPANSEEYAALKEQYEKNQKTTGLLIGFHRSLLRRYATLEFDLLSANDKLEARSQRIKDLETDYKLLMHNAKMKVRSFRLWCRVVLWVAEVRCFPWLLQQQSAAVFVVRLCVFVLI